MRIWETKTVSIWCLVCLASFFTACGELDDTVDGESAEKERWDARNSPDRFTDITLKYDFDSLPTSGRADVDVWPSTYWATYEDSINVQWKAGELSPAQKYDVAFNGWTVPEGFMDLKPYTLMAMAVRTSTKAITSSLVRWPPTSPPIWVMGMLEMVSTAMVMAKLMSAMIATA